MKDFYEAKREELADVDRQFVFAGVTFKLKPVMPGEVSGDFAVAGTPNFDGNMWDLLVNGVRRSLRPESRADWDALFSEERAFPITLEMVSDLIQALIEEEQDLIKERTGRPTTPLSPSSSTGGSTKTNSTEGSASKEEVASAISRSVPV